MAKRAEKPKKAKKKVDSSTFSEEVAINSQNIKSTLKYNFIKNFI